VAESADIAGVFVTQLPRASGGKILIREFGLILFVLIGVRFYGTKPVRVPLPVDNVAAVLLDLEVCLRSLAPLV
jgi:hypothetical protein